MVFDVYPYSAHVALSLSALYSSSRLIISFLLMSFASLSVVLTELMVTLTGACMPLRTYLKVCRAPWLPI